MKGNLNNFMLKYFIIMDYHRMVDMQLLFLSFLINECLNVKQTNVSFIFYFQELLHKI